ncbi:Outer membrane protein TolC [Bacteroides faecichinchillae]|uniref:Outer membrane protein TolC n=1 Tax=Bacteroides faecichinchillae TaxID=871325 RepID=A0A1M4WAC2_9BACE|nr:TolC family protein [Bacteroides faecichinchillae]THG68060.1 TolC family protein [Bacteroides faecichinchillae]SHE78208.1 Outer membrane protein TolC [Bacteroides faecichinchillae]
MNPKVICMKRIIYIITACIFLSVSDAKAQPQVRTLKDCLEEGLQNNYSLSIIHNEEQISKNNATLGNAGYLPTLDFSAGYKGNLDNIETKSRATGEITSNNGVYDQTVNVGLNLNWTIFDGFNISTTYQQLKILERQGETNTRIAIEDFIATLTSEYYNFIQQKIRLENFRYAMSLSKERLRIAEISHLVGKFSGLDYQQAKVDFNADSAQYIKQQELLRSSCIQLNELMANKNVDQFIVIKDSTINIDSSLQFEELWKSTLTTNASLLRADQNTTLSQLDYKKINSRNYPYLKLNTGYGYTFNKYDINANTRRGDLGFNAGVTVGFNIFDGNRRREKRNASLAIKNSRLERQELELALRSDLSNLWQAYRNNLQLLNLERQNVITAKDNHEIAMERYIQGDISGFEVREAQKSLLDAEERILTAEYNTKLCEISLLQISGKVMHYLESGN